MKPVDVVQKSPVNWRIGERRMKDLPAAFDVEPAKRCDRPCCHPTLTTNATSVSLNAAGSTTSFVLGHLISRVENPALSTLVISEYDPLLSSSFFSRARITRTYGPPVVLGAVDRRSICLASGSSGAFCQVGKGWQKVARWHLKKKVYFSHWRPLFYILFTPENLVGS